MPLSKEEEKKWRRSYLEYYKGENPQIAADLYIDLHNLEEDKMKFTEEIYNRIENLNEYDYEEIMAGICVDYLCDYLSMYRKNKRLSMKRIKALFKNNLMFEDEYLFRWTESKFKSKYNIPIQIFYLLNEKIGIPYRELEIISGIGKDTINSNIKFYKDYLKAKEEEDEIHSTLRRAKALTYRAKQKL